MTQHCIGDRPRSACRTRRENIENTPTLYATNLTRSGHKSIYKLCTQRTHDFSHAPMGSGRSETINRNTPGANTRRMAMADNSAHVWYILYSLPEVDICKTALSRGQNVFNRWLSHEPNTWNRAKKKNKKNKPVDAPTVCNTVCKE